MLEVYHYVSANPSFISSLLVLSIGPVSPTSRLPILENDAPEDGYAYRCGYNAQGKIGICKMLWSDGTRFRETALIQAH